MSSLDSKTYLHILQSESGTSNEFVEKIVSYIDEIRQEHDLESKIYEKKLSRYIQIIKQHYPDELKMALPYSCKEKLTKDKEISKSRYTYILHYEGRISLQDIQQFFNKTDKPAREFIYGYDVSRGETVVYADYVIAKQHTGCATFTINGIVPYGCAPKREEKKACLAYLTSLTDSS